MIKMQGLFKKFEDDKWYFETFERWVKIIAVSVVIGLWLGATIFWLIK